MTDTHTDHTAKARDYILFTSLLDSLTDLAQSRLIGIIRNRKRLVEALPEKSSDTRAHSATVSYDPKFYRGCTSPVRSRSSGIDAATG